MWRKILAGLLLALAVGPLITARASTLPPGFTDTVFENDPDGEPTAMEFAPDGRLFVLDQGGNVWVIKNGARLSTPFESLTVDSNGERGLLGIAFDPNFPTDPYVYLYYTATSPTIHNRVSRFTANGDVAVPASEVQLFNLPTLSATNHNGGAIHFGPDGKLYVAVGENANGANSQTLNNTLGKILRINKDGTIPSDNPFFGSTSGDSRAIWALGLRNPYTFAFDSGSALMYINDVGQNNWEEIDRGIAGANYGWPTTEGDFNQSAHPDFTRPLYTYSHSDGCAITGGAFYRPTSGLFPTSYVGKYFFADYCGQWIRVFNPTTSTATSFVTSTPFGPVDLKVGPDDRLYYLSRGDSNVHVIDYQNLSPAASITAPSPSLLYQAGKYVRFKGSATDPEQGQLPAKAYDWQVDLYKYTATPADGTFQKTVFHKTKVKSGRFRVPNTGEKSPNVFYRITLKVTDAGGATDEVTLDILPLLSTMTFQTDPPGMDFGLDGRIQAAPVSITGVAGMRRAIPRHIDWDGVVWQFKSRTPGPKTSRTLVTPASDTTFNVNYVNRQVVNGSFEIDANGDQRPDGWKSTRLGVPDGSDCSTPAEDVSCSLHLIGGSKSKTAAQTIRLMGGKGDSYTLDFATQSPSPSPNGFAVQLIMDYSNHTTQTQTFNLIPAATWSPGSLTVTAVRSYSSLRIKIISRAGATGEAWFDHFRLTFN